MYLLIDECCSKDLVQVAEDLGHTAQRTVSVRALGRAASDADIHAFANRNDAIIVTANGADFETLAGAGEGHPGMILMPNVIGKRCRQARQESTAGRREGLRSGAEHVCGD